MARIERLTRPPLTGDYELDKYLQKIADAVNLIPNISIISTSDGPETAGTYEGDPGTLAIDIGSSATFLWQKTDTGVGGWRGGQFS